ncbi:MAG TPA: hypothetical protein VMS64_16100 [Candidatus Methylomirabilis sp.]|nr:hypothetical protein [Candidatus Methylomirabilis sp.]
MKAMKRNILAMAGLVSLLTAAPTSAQELQYWGLWQSPGRGLIRLQGQYYTIDKGDEIPGFGKVEDVTPEMLIVRRTLTAEEKDDLETQGRIAPDVQTRRVPNMGSRVAPPLIPNTPLRLR